MYFVCRFPQFSRTYTVISRLIEGDFLDYKRVIPEGYHTRVTVDVRDFSNSIERASLIITERLKNPLRITFDGNITVRCQNLWRSASTTVTCWMHCGIPAATSWCLR